MSLGDKDAVEIVIRTIFKMPTWSDVALFPGKIKSKAEKLKHKTKSMTRGNHAAR